VLEDEGTEATALARLAQRLSDAEPEQQEAAERLIRAINDFLSS